MERVEQLLGRFVDFVITPIIMIIFTAGFFLFVWGLVQFLWNLDEGSHEEGKRHMVWGIVGMFVMVSVWGILMLLQQTFGLCLDPGGSCNFDTSGLDLPDGFLIAE